MDEYIKKEDAMEIVKRTSGDYAAAFSEIRKLPAADVAPVRHGRWIEKDKYSFGTFYDCTICGNCILDSGHSWNYCPNGGAKMDEEE